MTVPIRMMKWARTGGQSCSDRRHTGLNEITQTRLIVGAIVFAIVLLWAFSRMIERRRRRWVESLAVAFATTAAHGSYATSQFNVNVAGRQCEIAQGYRSRGMDGRHIRGLGLVVTVPLRRVSDIYNLTFKHRGHGRGTDSLIVRNSGYHPRDGWLTERLQAALLDFYDFAPDRAALSVEGRADVHHEPANQRRNVTRAGRAPDRCSRRNRNRSVGFGSNRRATTRRRGPLLRPKAEIGKFGADQGYFFAAHELVVALDAHYYRMDSPSSCEKRRGAT
jgi:hypothetical protein